MDGRLTSRLDRPSTVEVRGVAIGGSGRSFWAGPCAVESHQQIDETAAFLASCGVQMLRGGAFKPRTSPTSFQGLGEKALRWLAEAGARYGLVTVSEVLDGGDIPMVAGYVDILQIGSRNMQNFALLKQVGRSAHPVLLKRGFAATIEEFLLAAEYVWREGNEQVILCERGIRTFEPSTRNTLDLSAVPLVKLASRRPIIVDLAHALGRTDIMIPMARAALACGADGLMVEVHPDPRRALSDGPQSLDFAQFRALLDHVRPFLDLAQQADPLPAMPQLPAHPG